MRSCWILCCLLLASCARWPRLEFVSNRTLTEEDMIREAPVVLIGRVVDQQLGRGGRPLTKVEIAVENVLRGHISGPRAEFYYFAADPGLLLGDGRYLFFLTRTADGVLRALRDDGRSSIEIASGRHARLPLRDSRPLAERIAVLLLTPGDGLNPEYFSRRLTPAFARRTLGTWRTVKLLKTLAADPRPAIRLRACADLTSFWGQDRCWDDLDAGDGADLPAISVSRSGEANWRRITADADQWWKSMSARYPPDELLDQLRLLTDHKDARVRARYCRFLRAHYPAGTDCGCPAPRMGAGPLAML